MDMKFRLAKRSERGHALAEAVMAIAILGVTSVAVIGAFNQGFFLIGLLRENQRATQIILEKAETIRLYNWDQVNTPGFIPATFTDVYDPQGKSGHQGVVYQGRMVKSAFPSNTSYKTNMCQLTITVTWTGSGGLARTRSMATFVAKDGIQNYIY
jgi:hypothetical protein